MKTRMFLSYGAVAAVTAVAATVLAASEPEVRAVETSVDWSAPLDWSTLEALAPPAEPRPAVTPPQRPAVPTASRT